MHMYELNPTNRNNEMTIICTGVRIGFGIKS
jgi:hypothetical protein